MNAYVLNIMECLDAFIRQRMVAITFLLPHQPYPSCLVLGLGSTIKSPTTKGSVEAVLVRHIMCILQVTFFVG